MWGLAFKANTDDIREASSLDNIALLLKRSKIVAYDAVAESNVQKLLGDKINMLKECMMHWKCRCLIYCNRMAGIQKP
jgi:UDPglucose 6-dehydrogenase